MRNFPNLYNTVFSYRHGRDSTFLYLLGALRSMTRITSYKYETSYSDIRRSHAHTNTGTANTQD